ncbi:hypothetical protein O6H91_09G054500 [Diphasiastrum complanatum]|uniref:Uncharacterized protein n=1 Tax=Diphasiastrum complanatum TaxID=34168 RepID=A0ACC2CPH2_DIPCM|nr:hypothetical protein O6H91_09G054500 [Diphasiastrum complanatum]
MASSSCLLNQVANVYIQRLPVVPSKTETTRRVSSLKIAAMCQQSLLQGSGSSASRPLYPVISAFGFRVSGTNSLVAFAQSIATTPATESETEVQPDSVDDSLPDLSASPVSDSISESEEAPALKAKKRTKPLKQIMELISKEAIAAATKDKEIPDLRPGDVVQLRVEVPQNKKRISLLKGIVISRRNNGINTTFRIRRVLAGVGVEMVFPLYSPNIKEIKVLSHRKVRRAKLFYLRDKLARLSSV